jgi:hypothetical protein
MLTIILVVFNVLSIILTTSKQTCAMHVLTNPKFEHANLTMQCKR